MAWTALVNRAVGFLVTATNWNELLGASGNLEMLKLHKHSGADGDGDDEIGPLALADLSDAAAPSAPGAGKTRVYATSGRPRYRDGAAGTDKAIANDPSTTEGDLLYRGSGSILDRLAAGTSGQFLKTNGSGAAPSWDSVSGGDLYNFLTNPGFEVWQRGAGAFTADGVYTADRWLMDEAGTDTLSVTREGTTKKDDSLYSLAAVFVLGSGAGATKIYQQLSINANDENHMLRGRTLSARIAVRTATASAARIFIESDGTSGTTNYSGYHTGGSTFENLDVTNITVPTDATYVRIGVAFAASATVYMDDATLTMSATAGTYIGLVRAEEWARCHRYYEVHGALNTAGPIIRMPAAAAGVIAAYGSFLERKAHSAPTCTKAGTWIQTNCDQPTLQQSDERTYSWFVSASGAGAMNSSPDSTDDTFTFVANP